MDEWMDRLMLEWVDGCVDEGIAGYRNGWLDVMMKKKNTNAYRKIQK